MTVDLSAINFKSTAVSKVVDPLVDLGNLLLMDRDPVEGDISHNLLERARDNTQLLFNNIWELDKKHVDAAILAVLPEPTFRLPREKRIPEPKEPTKWEQYAKTKGIVKKPRAKKEFDEATKEWKPTYGFKRGKDDTKDWLIEVPGNAEDPNKDYFAERMEKKKERVAKNEMQRMKNLARQLKTKVKTGPSIDAAIGVGVPAEDKSKQQVRFAIDRAKVATASVGKYQRLAKGEKVNIKTGKKRKYDSNVGNSTDEKQRSLDVLSKINAKKAKIIEEKATAVAGPEQKERKESTGKNKPVRQKSQIHRQQWFKNNKSNRKQSRGNSGGKKTGGKKK